LIHFYKRVKMGEKSSKSGGGSTEVVKVYKWDGVAVKNALDDAITEVMTKKLPYTENHSLRDGRLFICALAVFIAGFALVWDFFFPFPQSKPILIGCVGGYFLLMGVLTLYTTFKEKGIFVVVMQKDPAGLDPDIRWEVASNMKKYDDVYEVSVKVIDGKSGASRETSFKKSVADFIDDNGVVCQDLIEAEMMKMHNSLASNKKDK